MTTKINNAGPDTIQTHGWQIQRGYVYRVVAADESAWECTKEIPLEDGSIHFEDIRFGYFGSDVPPCGADYLYDEDGDYLVISCEADPADIDTVEGFTLERAELQEGEHYSDGTWQFRVLEVSSDGEVILAGKA